MMSKDFLNCGVNGRAKMKPITRKRSWWQKATIYLGFKQVMR